MENKTKDRLILTAIALFLIAVVVVFGNAMMAQEEAAKKKSQEPEPTPVELLDAEAERIIPLIDKAVAYWESEIEREDREYAKAAKKQMEQFGVPSLKALEDHYAKVDYIVHLIEIHGKAKLNLYFLTKRAERDCMAEWEKLREEVSKEKPHKEEKPPQPSKDTVDPEKK